MELRRPHLNDLANRLVDTSSLLAHNPPGTLSACVYRGTALAQIIPSLLQLGNLADWGTNLLISQFGPLIWSRRVSLVYTHVAQSMWRRQSRRYQVTEMSEVLDGYSKFVPRGLQPLFEATRIRLMSEFSLGTKIRRAIRHPLLTTRSLVGKVLRALRLIRNAKSRFGRCRVCNAVPKATGFSNASVESSESPT